MPQIVVGFRNDVMQRFQRTLADLGERDARKILNMATNKIGRKAFVAVKRELKRVTGIEYDKIEQSAHEKKSIPSTLTYSVRVSGSATNLRQFKPRSTKKQFSAAPWNERRAFPNTFQPGVPGSNPQGIVYHRIGDTRKIKPSFGPNLAREVNRGAVASGWSIMAAEILPEVQRLIKLKLQGLGPFASREE